MRPCHPRQRPCPDQRHQRALLDPLGDPDRDPRRRFAAARSSPRTRSKPAPSPACSKRSASRPIRQTFLGRSGNGYGHCPFSRTKPQFARSRPISPQLRTIDRLVIVTAPGDDTAVTSRVFAAYHGIDEDPVTGVRPCRLGSLLGGAARPHPLHRAAGQQARRPYRLRARRGPRHPRRPLRHRDRGPFPALGSGRRPYLVQRQPRIGAR